MAGWDDFPVASPFGKPAAQGWDMFPQADALSTQSQQPATFNERFGADTYRRPELKSALEDRARIIQSGGRIATPAQSLNIAQENVPAAAEQRVLPNPNPQDFIGRATVDEAGNVLALDPITGEVKPSDSKTQYVLTDPQTGQMGVYARNPENAESTAGGFGRVAMQGFVSGAPTRLPSMATNLKPAVPAAERLIKSYEEAKPIMARASEDAFTTPEVFKQWADITKATLQNAQNQLTPAKARETHRLLDNVVSSKAMSPNSVVTMRNLDDLRFQLGELAGSGGPEGAAATIAKSELDAFADRAFPEAQAVMQAGRGDYAAGKSAQMLTQKAYKAEQTAARQERETFPTTIRTQITQILTNPELRRGLSPDVISALEQANTPGASEKLLRYVGTKLLGWGPGVSGGAFGHMIGGPIGALIGAVAGPLIGAGAKLLAGRIVSKDVERINELIRSNSPYAKSVQNSYDTWQRYAKLASENPKNPRYGAMLKLSSNNFSNNLRAAGIDVSSASLQGTHAESEPDGNEPGPGR